MSNFPISLFHKSKKMPGVPVLGIKIGVDRNNYNKNESFGDFAGAVLGAMMAWADNDFFVQHPVYRNLIGVIDTGSYNWLDFSIPEAGKIDLFVRGARAARDFLMRFEWNN